LTWKAENFPIGKTRRRAVTPLGGPENGRDAGAGKSVANVASGSTPHLDSNRGHVALELEHSAIYDRQWLCYCSTMITMTVRDANQNFSKMLAEVEKGETVLITKNGKTVAELRPRSDDPRDDPEWRAAYERMVALMRATPATGYRVGKITEDDKYGDAPLGDAT